MTWTVVVATSANALAAVISGARWLRVAQREHYIAGSCARFARRWVAVDMRNLGLAIVALAGVVAGALWPLAALATALAIVLAPLGLSVRGRSSPLVTTRRFKRLAALWVCLQAGVVGLGVAIGSPVVLSAVGAVLVPVIVDLALALTTPLERSLLDRFVAEAAARLRAVRPVVVAVTGSYGKTSTKHHIAHLVAGTRSVVATPASFNNRAGLARAINEHLAEGTEVFVAEMGTYGRGEIAELCRWCPPDIAVITAIGPVHLERFGSEDRILEAKAEILEGAETVVLNVDEPRLAKLADSLDGRVVVRCSGTRPDAGVSAVSDGESVRVTVGGSLVVETVAVARGVRPSNVACAVAVALQLGVTPEDLRHRLATLPVVANRLTVETASSGVVVMDDTYNSNPAGARAALAALASLDARRRVLVTPGMVELGPRQAQENEALGEQAAAVATDLVIVGRTNRKALARGWWTRRDRPPPVLVDDRQEAVAWVRRTLGPGDAVLYENDLPDHYP